MKPNFSNGNYILIKLTRKIKEGDFVVFQKDDRKYFKKISHFEGDGIFVVGLNLRESTDSRNFGLITQDQLIGKYLFKLI